MRPLWSGALNVGLVNIPVSVVSAYSHKGVSFRLLHKKCKSRISYGRHCPTCKAEVEWDDVVRAYEFRKDRYVVMSDEDLRKVDPKLAKMIEIREFIDAAGLDPIFVSNVHYLIPGKDAAKPYFLLHDVMAAAGKIALAKMIMRDKEQWVAVRPSGDALQLVDLHYQEEILSVKDLGLPKHPQLKPGDARLAQKIVASLSAPFAPGKYRDEFEDKLKKVVARKARGKKITVKAPSVRPTIDDLTSALEKSVRRGKKR